VCSSDLVSVNISQANNISASFLCVFRCPFTRGVFLKEVFLIKVKNMASSCVAGPTERLKKTALKGHEPQWQCVK
jgi:hypothetical protein